VPCRDGPLMTTGSLFTAAGPLLVAHRGDLHEAPENTIAAFELALRNGADAIEIDVQITRDRVPVVLHDERLERTTNGTGRVRDRRWDELVVLDAGSWFDPDFARQHVPSLAQAVDWSGANRVPLLVELKTHPLLDEGVAAAVADVLAARSGEHVVLYSSDHLLVAELAEMIPEVRRGIILNERCGFTVDSLRRTGSSLLSQTIFCLTPQTVAEAHALGCVVSAEVRHRDDVATLLDWGVDLIVTQRASVRTVRTAIDKCHEAVPLHG